MTKPNLEEFKAALRLVAPGVAIHAYPDRPANGDTPSANLLFTGTPGAMIGVYFYDLGVSLGAVQAVLDAYGIEQKFTRESSRNTPYMFISLSCFADD